jgi:hypothetical protein
MNGLYCYTLYKNAARNSDVDNGGTNQTTLGSENSYFHALRFCATVVNIAIWHIPTWLFYSVVDSGHSWRDFIYWLIGYVRQSSKIHCFVNMPYMQINYYTVIHENMH